MDNDPDLQRALLLSLGGNDTQIVDSPGVVDAGPAAVAEDEEVELERAIALSCTLGLNDAPDEVRKLLRTVATNFRRTLEDRNCSAADFAKFRQVNDEAVRKRTCAAQNPDEAYSVASRVLRGLGFEIQYDVETQAVARWIVPMDAPSPPAALLNELAPNMSQPQPCIAHSGASSHVQGPQSLANFDVLDVSSVAGCGHIRVIVHPRACSTLVSTDCMAWAAQTGSGRSHWGSHSRRGEDDRVMLTLSCCLSQSGCAAHWYNHRGDEKLQPSLICDPSQWRWCETYTNQTFLVRLVPRQDVAVCGIKITCRPYETDGHLVLMIIDRSTGDSKILEMFNEVQRSLPKDNREQAAQPQGGRPAPPPPGFRNNR